MTGPVRKIRRPVVLRLAVALAALGGACLVASMLIGFLIADHSSSDGSPSSLLAIGLGGFGFFAVLISAAVLGGLALARLGRVSRRRPHRTPGRD